MSAHVLLVEDSVLVTDALRTLLEAMGHRVSVAGDSATALATCAAESPDILLLDLSLGRDDGLATLAELQRRGRAPRVVAAMTGHDDPATRARCLAAGCRDVLVKPVPPRELLRRLDAWAAEGG